jgi:hypothetical protein
LDDGDLLRKHAWRRPVNSFEATTPVARVAEERWSRCFKVPLARIVLPM